MTYNLQLNVPQQLVRYRDFRNIEYVRLEEEFLRIDWSVLYNLISVDDQLSFLQHNLNYLYDLVVPLRTKNVNRHNKPWFTQDIKQVINRRDSSYARWKRFKTAELHEEYRVTRRTTNRLIKKAKSDYYASKFSAAIGSKKTWQEIREIGIG